jgi:hypothetical protein
MQKLQEAMEELKRAPTVLAQKEQQEKAEKRSRKDEEVSAWLTEGRLEDEMTTIMSNVLLKNIVERFFAPTQLTSLFCSIACRRTSKTLCEISPGTPIYTEC